MENLIFLAHVVLLMVLSPIISRIFRIPTPVIEILLGSLAVWSGILYVGNDVFKNLAKIGFFYLMFLAGLEIDIQRFLYYKDRFLKKALLYFVFCVVFCVVLCVVFCVVFCVVLSLIIRVVNNCD